MEKKIKLTTQQLLASIKVNITAVYRELSSAFKASVKIPCYTKKGPGRKHKQGVQKYYPRKEEVSFFRRHPITKERLW